MYNGLELKYNLLVLQLGVDAQNNSRTDSDVITSANRTIHFAGCFIFLLALDGFDVEKRLP